MSGVTFLVPTRSGRTALIQALPEPLEGKWSLIGRIDGRDLDLWRADGAWRESGDPHPNDLLLSPALAKGFQA